MMRSKAETPFCMPFTMSSPDKSPSSRLQHRVDQGRLAGLHLCNRAPQRARNVLGLRDRALGVPAAGLRQPGKIRLRGGDVLANIGALHRRASVLGHMDLMLPVVVVGTVV